MTVDIVFFLGLVGDAQLTNLSQFPPADRLPLRAIAMRKGFVTIKPKAAADGPAATTTSLKATPMAEEPPKTDPPALVDQKSEHKDEVAEEEPVESTPPA